MEQNTLTSLKRAHSQLKQILHLFNSAPKEVLLRLPGIGSTRVELILQKRVESNGKLRIKDVVSTLHLGPAVLTNITQEAQTPSVIKFAVLYQTLAENTVGRSRRYVKLKNACL